MKNINGMIKENANKEIAMVNVKETAKAKKANKVTRYGEVQLGNLLEKYFNDMIYSDMFDETIKKEIGDYYDCYEHRFLDYMCDKFKEVVFGGLEGMEVSDHIERVENYFGNVEYHDNDTRTFFLYKGKTCKDVVKDYLECYVEDNYFYGDLWDQYGEEFCKYFSSCIGYSRKFYELRDDIKIRGLNKDIDELIESKFKDREDFVNSLSVKELDDFIKNLPEPICYDEYDMEYDEEEYDEEEYDLGHLDELDEDEREEKIQMARIHAIAKFYSITASSWYYIEDTIAWQERTYLFVEYIINK